VNKQAASTADDPEVGVEGGHKLTRELFDQPYPWRDESRRDEGSDAGRYTLAQQLSQLVGSFGIESR